MVLRITNNDEEYGVSTYKVSLSNFARREYHPMIASINWDRVYIDCNESTPSGFIGQLVKTIKVIPVFDRENVTPKVLQLLCEVAPDYASKFRVAYINGKESFDKVLDDAYESRWNE